MAVPLSTRSASILLLGMLTACLEAKPPLVRNVNVRGLQIGGTTTLIIDGEELGTAPKLLLSFPCKQVLKPGMNPRQATFEVTLDATVTPGYANLRVATEGGVTAPVVIALDRMPQIPLAPTVETLPVALHGVVAGSTPVETKFNGKAGQKVIVEVEAQRLGSKLRPVVHLYNAKRLQLDWAWGTPSLFGDTRLEATLPADGAYVVSLHDAEYAPPAPNHFRLKIGQWAYVDQVFPQVVGKEQKSVELIGSTQASKLDLPAARVGSLLPLAWPVEGLWSGPRPFVRLAAHAEVVEQKMPEGKIQDLPEAPVGISGRLLVPREEDRYRLPVKAGAKLRFEVFAERIGSPLDVALVLRNDKGDQLVRAEDSPGTLDPVLDYTVPAGMTSLVVGVVDAQERGGPRGIYRLVVESPGAATMRNDFELFTTRQGLTLPVGGRGVMPILIDRRGFKGSVTLTADGLPAGLKLDSAVIPAEGDGVLATVTRGDAAGASGLMSWKGRGDDGQERQVALRGHPLERLQPWLATEQAVGLTNDKGAEFVVDWRGLPVDAAIVPGLKLALPVKLTRPATMSGVRLTLLTSQRPVLVNGQPDANQTLRAEKAVEVAVKVLEGEVTMLVPPTLSGAVYDVTVQAELLAPDRVNVLATTFAPVRRMTVKNPTVVLLDGPPRVEAKLDPKTGATIDIKGRLERREGGEGDVVLTLTGIPAGVRADPVTVKAGISPFAVKVVIPPGTLPGEFKNLKLSATVAPDPKVPAVRVKSRDIELTLVIVK